MDQSKFPGNPQSLGGLGVNPAPKSTMSSADQQLFSMFMSPSAPISTATTQPVRAAAIKSEWTVPPNVGLPAFNSASSSASTNGGNNNNLPPQGLQYSPLPTNQAFKPIVVPPQATAAVGQMTPATSAIQMPTQARQPLGGRPAIQQGQVGSVNMQQLGAPPSQYVVDSTATSASNTNLLSSIIPGSANFMRDVDLSGLSPGQEAAIRSVLEGKNILLTGAGGTGKSFVIKRIKDIYEKKNLAVAVTSMTGASAIIIEGKTIHSWAGIAICNSKESALKRVQTYKAPQQRIMTTSLLIIDEVSMMSDVVLDILDHVFRIVRNSTKAFGGMQVVLCGDFFQLKPVKCDTFAFESPNWSGLVQEVHELTQIFRQESAVFCRALNEVRIGEVSPETVKLFESCIGRQFTGDIKPTELYPVNEDVRHLNDDELWKLITESNPCRQIDSLDEIIESPKSRKPYDSKFMDDCKARLNKDCVAPEHLQLCIGAQVMLIKNLNVAAGLCNGSRCLVIGFAPQGQPVVRFLSGQEMQLQTVTWYMRVSETARIRRTQFPISLAWAVSIHKSQGASLDLVRIDLGKKIFCTGQFYTAVSRARTLEGLSIIAIDWKKVLVDPKVKSFYAKHKQHY